MTGYTVRRYEQLDTFPETIEQELRPAVCERRETDRFKENSIIDINRVVFVGLQCCQCTDNCLGCDDVFVFPSIVGTYTLELWV